MRVFDAVAEKSRCVVMTKVALAIAIVADCKEEVLYAIDVTGRKTSNVFWCNDVACHRGFAKGNKPEKVRLPHKLSVDWTEMDLAVNKPVSVEDAALELLEFNCLHMREAFVKEVSSHFEASDPADLQITLLDWEDDTHNWRNVVFSSCDLEYVTLARPVW